jgi:hypothetical protein
VRPTFNVEISRRVCPIKLRAFFILGNYAYCLHSLPGCVSGAISGRFFSRSGRVISANLSFNERVERLSEGNLGSRTLCLFHA